MISPLQRVATPPVEIEPRTAGNKELIGIFQFVIFAFDKAFPLPVFVYFIKDKELGISRPGRSHDAPPVSPIVPVEVCVVLEMRCDEVTAEGCFPDLARPSDKDHLVLKILDDKRRQIPFPEHVVSIQRICLKANLLAYKFAFEKFHD